MKRALMYNFNLRHKVFNPDFYWAMIEAPIQIIPITVPTAVLFDFDCMYLMGGEL
jgi:hypothetical protein